MPLLDHFHPPLEGRRHWEGFHGRWAAAMAAALTKLPPKEFFADSRVTGGARSEVDAAPSPEGGGREPPAPGGAATAVHPPPGAPPPPVAVMPAVFPDDF